MIITIEKNIVSVVFEFFEYLDGIKDFRLCDNALRKFIKKAIYEDLNPLEVLNLTPPFTKEELKNRYRQLAFKYHPDKNQGDPTAEDRFKEVGYCYDKILQNFDEYNRIEKQPERKKRKVVKIQIRKMAKLWLPRRFDSGEELILFFNDGSKGYLIKNVNSEDGTFEIVYSDNDTVPTVSNNLNETFERFKQKAEPFVFLENI